MNRCVGVKYVVILVCMEGAQHTASMGYCKHERGGALALALEMCKVFCALAVTAKTCVLKVTINKVVNFLHP